MSEISLPNKCEAILKTIISIVNKENIAISFERDWGDYTATIIKGNKHSHIGIPNEKDEVYFGILIDHLYDLLVDNTGLSWEYNAEKTKD